MLSGQGFGLQKDYNILLGMFVQKGWEPLPLGDEHGQQQYTGHGTGWYCYRY